MKDIRKENVVKTITLSEEEMIEVVGGKAVNSFIVPSNFYKGLKWLKWGR
ncbi:MAG: lactacin F inducer peptide precursor [Lactobacillus sp.]|nr:lactacin F inducer peptide precursor [Lactobacillus sp.]MDE7050326.1 lactacin F inducer peptide precursor [Lactobacillus sp.]